MLIRCKDFDHKMLVKNLLSTEHGEVDEVVAKRYFDCHVM